MSTDEPRLHRRRRAPARAAHGADRLRPRGVPRHGLAGAPRGRRRRVADPRGHAHGGRGHGARRGRRLRRADPGPGALRRARLHRPARLLLGGRGPPRRARRGRHLPVGALPDDAADLPAPALASSSPRCSAGPTTTGSRTCAPRARAACTAWRSCRTSTPSGPRRRSAGWRDLPHIVGVQVRPNPAMDWKPLNNEVYDPIWAAASEAGLPVGFHPLSSNDLPGAVQGLRLANLGHLRHPGPGPGGLRGRQHLLRPGDRQPGRHDERRSPS